MKLFDLKHSSGEKRKGSSLLRRAVCAGLAGVLLLSLAACGEKTGETVSRAVYQEKDIQSVYPKQSAREMHVSSTSLKRVAQSGLIELYIDEKTYAVAVKETSQNKMWYALPQQDNGKEENRAAVVSLEVLQGGKHYFLNSQDNSVAFDTASYELIDNGLKVTYVIAADAQTAKKDFKSRTAQDIVFDVSVTYTLEDGSFFAQIDCKSLAETTGEAKVLKLGFLEYFGASTQGAADDFILVPDGSGALIRTAQKAKANDTLRFAVYGQDAALPAEENVYSALVPSFGVKQGSSAFAVLIEQGDALATILADRAEGETGYYRVGAQFTITPSAQEKTEDGITQYVSTSGYDGSLKLCYRFLSGENASYSGMALAVREQLIRDAVLSTRTLEEADNLPLTLNLVGSLPNKESRLSTSKKLTSFEQAEDLLVQMKAKGINQINLCYQGALTGGFNQKQATDAKLLISLGGKMRFNDLYESMATQKLQLFLAADLLSTNARDSFSAGSTALGINGEAFSYAKENPFADYVGPQSFQRGLRSLDTLERAAREFMVNTKKVSMTGYCVSDAGQMLYSNFNKAFTSRQAAAQQLSKQSESLGSNRKLMVDTGNFYMLKNADIVTNLPLSSAVSQDDSYETIPFVQMLLHGIVDYSGKAINLADDPQTQMLRSIEYGACPSYTWSYDALKAKEGAEKAPVVNYEDSLADAAAYYKEANQTLADLRGARMTKHSMVQENVYCTEYDSSSLVYVNYGETEATVNGVTIPARSFLRLN